MIGLSVTGRSYNFSTKEVSNVESTGKVIFIENKEVKIWINGSSSPLICSVDVLTCKNDEDGKIIEIPIFLLCKINEIASVDRNFTVEGKKMNFICTQDNLGDFHEDLIKSRGFIIGKYSISAGLPNF